MFLTVRQHALAHRLLWKIDGRQEDKLAWLGLAGIIGKEEIVATRTPTHRQRISNALRGRELSATHIENHRQAILGKPNPHTPEWVDKRAWSKT